MQTAVPQGQKLYTTPQSQQRFYENNPEYGAGIDPRVYLARQINDYTRTITDSGNAVIIGFKTLVEDYTGSVVTFTITPGKAIVDNTLIELHEEVSIDIDVSLRPNWTDIILVIDYQFINAVTQNPYQIKAYLYDALNSTYNASSIWNHNDHNLILGVFTQDYPDNGSEVTNVFNSSLGLEGLPRDLTIEGVSGIPGQMNTRQYNANIEYMLAEGIIYPECLLTATGNTGEYPGFCSNSGSFWWILGLPVGSDTDIAYVTANVFNNEF